MLLCHFSEWRQDITQIGYECTHVGCKTDEGHQFLAVPDGRWLHVLNGSYFAGVRFDAVFTADDIVKFDGTFLRACFLWIQLQAFLCTSCHERVQVLVVCFFCDWLYNDVVSDSCCALAAFQQLVDSFLEYIFRHFQVEWHPAEAVAPKWSVECREVA